MTARKPTAAEDARWAFVEACGWSGSEFDERAELLDTAIAAARAEAVAPVMDVLRQLVEAQESCGFCKAPATGKLYLHGTPVCDEHAKGNDGFKHRKAAPLRLALALLAAGEKAGK